MNLMDDYFDYKVNNLEHREIVQRAGMRSRIVKYPYLTDGSATHQQLGQVVIIFGTIALLVGAVIFYFRGITVIWPVLAAIILGVEYSGPPFKLGYRGLGELVIGTIFGPLLMIGMQITASSEVTLNMILLSIAAGLLVINILFSHSVLDLAADQSVGKKTLASVLGKRWLNMSAVVIFNIVPFIIIVAGVIFGIFHPLYLAALVTLPMACYLIWSLSQFTAGRDIDLKIKPWMGPMGNWKGICESGIGWFMIRWLVARNLVTFFCLVLTIVNIVIAIF